MNDLERELAEIHESLKTTSLEYNQSAQCLVEALTGIHERLERIEKWILDAEAEI